MKYLKQLGIILAVAFAGEILHALLPLPVPASVYGIILLFTLLLTGIVKVEMIREVSAYFISILPIMFIAPGVGLIETWDVLAPVLLPYILICITATTCIMFSAGHVTQFLIRKAGSETSGASSFPETSQKTGTVGKAEKPESPEISAVNERPDANGKAGYPGKEADHA